MIVKFGKYFGKPIDQVVKSDPKYCQWALTLQNPTEKGLCEFVEYLRNTRQPTSPTPSPILPTTKHSHVTTPLGPNSDSQWDSSSFEDLLTDDIFQVTNPPPVYTTTIPSKPIKNFTPANTSNSQQGQQNRSHILSAIEEFSEIEAQKIVSSFSHDQQSFLDDVILCLISPNHFTVFLKGKGGHLSSYVPKDLFSALVVSKDLLGATHSQGGEQGSQGLSRSKRVGLSSQDFGAKSVETIPDFVCAAFDRFRPFMKQRQVVSRKVANILTKTESPRTLSKDSEVISLLGENLAESLKEFKNEGVQYGLKRNGRCIIGDEMGLGKTLQALAIAAIYHDEWPLLIVCPSSVKFQWRDQTIKWLPHLIRHSQVSVIKSGKESIDFTSTKVIIVSFDLLKNEKFHYDYRIIIVDESHYLKNQTAQRTSQILPLLTKTRRAILLSGTPALNKPSELFTQVEAVLPGFAKRQQFCQRYCNQKYNVWSRKTEFTDFRLPEELHCFLRHTVMIRRLKKNVQSQLPPKLRSKIPIECSGKEARQMVSLMSKLRSVPDTGGSGGVPDSIFQLLPQKSGTGVDGVSMSEESTSPHPGISDKVDQSVIGELFKLSGIGKIGGACQHLSYLLDIDCKCLVFGHHKVVMDELDSFLVKRKVNFIRIDGSTSSSKREGYVKKFQEDEKCRVALLSITACSHGLNLTAAGTVVFAELYWVPGVIVQAEDRCHRIGTTFQSVDIHYLIGEKSIDELMWKILQKKWQAITSTLDGVLEDYSANNDFSKLGSVKSTSSGAKSKSQQHGSQSQSSLPNSKSIGGSSTLSGVKSQKGSKRQGESGGQASLDSLMSRTQMSSQTSSTSSLFGPWQKAAGSGVDKKKEWLADVDSNFDFEEDGAFSSNKKRRRMGTTPDPSRSSSKQFWQSNVYDLESEEEEDDGRIDGKISLSYLKKKLKQNS